MHAISNSVRLLIVLVIAMVCPMGLVSGQRPVMEKTAADTIVMPKWEPHLTVGTGFMGTSYGDNRLFTTVAPSLKYCPNDRWTISGGFRMKYRVNRKTNDRISEIGFGSSYLFEAGMEEGVNVMEGRGLLLPMWGRSIG